MNETVDLIYYLMNNACGSNWIGLLGVNVCSSVNAGFAKTGYHTKSHPRGHVVTNCLISLNLNLHLIDLIKIAVKNTLYIIY